MKLTVLLVAMKGLINSHKEAIKKYTDLDLPAIERVTYLHDFDREVQYVLPTYTPYRILTIAQVPILGISN
jgi:hypothetical protein